MLILFLFVALTVPSLIHHEISWLFSKQMWPIFNSSNTITLLTFQNSSGIHFNIYSHIKSLCAYSHNILTEWDKSSLRGSACKWSLVFSVKMPPNMIWNTKYHLWHHLGPQSSRHLNLITQNSKLAENHIDVYSHTSKTLRHGKIYYHLK